MSTRLAIAQPFEVEHAGHTYILVCHPSQYDAARCACLDWQQNPELPFDFVASNKMLDQVRMACGMFPSEPE